MNHEVEIALLLRSSLLASPEKPLFFFTCVYHLFIFLVGQGGEGQ
jgi:hypothetical protein